MSEQRAVDTSICPICGRVNQCATAAGETDEPCWCTQVVIDPRVLDRVPPELRGIACVCAECAAGEAGAAGAVADAME